MLRKIGFVNRTDTELSISVQMTRETLNLTVEQRTGYSSNEEGPPVTEDDDPGEALPPRCTTPSHEANFNIEPLEAITLALRPVDLIGWSDTGDPMEVNTIMNRVEKAARDMPSLHLELVKVRGHDDQPFIAISFNRENLI